MTEPTHCTCGAPLPPPGPQGGRRRKHCLTCRPPERRPGRKPGCPHCPHCASEAARVLALEEVAAELERQEWRAAAQVVRDMGGTT